MALPEAAGAEGWPSDNIIASDARVLLVGADPHWARAVRHVARGLGRMAVDTVQSGQPALLRLVYPRSRYSHVLVNPARDDGLLLPILGLTCDEDASGAELLLLGRSASAPSHICVIPGPVRAEIWAGIAMGCRAVPIRPPTVAALRAALAERRIEARYQPIVRLADGVVVGVEALARLHRPGERLIGPDHFVPRMEDAGLAAQLTRLMATRSFADLTSITLARHRLSVSLNVPLDVILLPTALDRLDADRRAAGIEASRVLIELTESRVVSNPGQLRPVVERLRKTGHPVAIDDISPAMANYEALLDLPFTSVKLDKDVVSRSAARGAAADFVKRIVKTARTRGMTVVVEGVEDIATLTRMRQFGADLAQGFAIGRPMPASVLPTWMNAWHDRPLPPS